MSSFTKSIYQIRRSSMKGFSLIEMIIYIFILILILAIIMNIIVSVLRSGRIIKSLRNIENSAISAMERLTRELRRSESVNTGLSVFDLNPGRLVLEGTDDMGAPRVVEFYLSGERLLFKENGIDIGALSLSDARVSNLIFRHFLGPNSEGIRVEMVINSGTSTHYRSENYYFSALSR